MTLFPELSPKVLDTLGALLISPCERPHIAPPADGPVALRTYLDSDDVWRVLEEATLKRGWCVPENVREVVSAIGETWGWANKGGVRDKPIWAQDPPKEEPVASILDSQRSDGSVVPPSVEDEPSPDPFSMLDLPSPMLGRNSKGKEREIVAVSGVSGEVEGDEQEDGLATPKARPRVLGLVPDSEGYHKLSEDADVPSLPLAPSSPTSYVNASVDRGRPGRSCDWISAGNGHRQASAERTSLMIFFLLTLLILFLSYLIVGRAHKRRRVRNRSAVRISPPQGASAMVFDGVELSPMRPIERVRYLSVSVGETGEGCSGDVVGNREEDLEPELVKPRTAGVTAKDVAHSPSREGSVKRRSNTAPLVVPQAPPHIIPSLAGAAASLSSSAPGSPTSPIRRAHTTPHSQLQRLARLKALRGARSGNAEKTSNSQSIPCAGDHDGKHEEEEVLLQTQDLALVQEYLYDMQGVLNEELRRKYRLGTSTGTRAGVGKS